MTIVCQKHLFGDIREKKGDEICSASRTGMQQSKASKGGGTPNRNIKKKKYVKTMWTSAEENQNRHGMVSGEKRNGFMLSEPGFV